MTGSEIYTRLLKSSVWINLRVSGGTITGSGSLINSEHRIVLTNFHVVHFQGRTAKEVRVAFPSYSAGQLQSARNSYQSQLRNAKVLTVDPSHDLALLQVDSVPSDTEPVPLAKSSAGPGDLVHSVGNPGRSDALWIYTSGTVRTAPYQKRWKVKSGSEFFDFDTHIIETQSPTNAGDSGGPMVNDRGELVAVTQGGAMNANSISYFIDVFEVKNLLRSQNITWTEGRVPNKDGRKLTSQEIVRLASLLQHQQSEVRLQAASLLAGAGAVAGTAVPALTGALKDSSPEVRGEAARALGEIGSESSAALTDLLALLKDNNRLVRFQTLRSIYKIGPTSPHMAEDVASQLTTPDAEIQRHALMVLKKLGVNARDAVPALSTFLAGNDVQLHPLALEIIELMGGTVTVGFLDHSNAKVRGHAAMLLAKSGEAKNAVDELARRLDDPDLDVRIEAANALATAGPRASPALPRLILLLDDRAVQLSSLKAISAIGPRGTDLASKLSGLLLESTGEVKVQTLITLAKLGPAAKDALPSVASILADSNTAFHEPALELLSKIGPDAATVVPSLDGFMKRTSGAGRLKFVAVVPDLFQPKANNTTLIGELCQGLESPDTTLATASLKAIAKVGKPAAPAVPQIVEIIKKPLEPKLQLQAIKTLGSMHEAAAPAVPYLTTTFKNPAVLQFKSDVHDEICEALTQIGAPAVKSVVKLAIYEQFPIFRIKALNILGKMGGQAKEALAPLQTALQFRERDPQVRPVLADTIKRIRE